MSTADIDDFADIEPLDIRPMIRMKELAKTLGVDRSTIYRWVVAKTFPAPVPVGDHAMAFYQDEVAAWQKAREGQSPAPLRGGQLKPLKPRVRFR